MKKIESHINRLFADIPESEGKRQLMQEVTQDLQEKVSDLIAQGKAEEDAINKAIVDFGDIEDIKKELSVRKKPNIRSRRAALNLGFSLWGSGLIVTLMLFINFYYTPDIIWFVYPTFGVLWWPLAMVFYWLRVRREDDELE